jgi:hypothetical protein
MCKIIRANTILLLSLNVIVGLGQNDTLNKINTKGKKQGYWICHLDDKFKITDSTKGVYVGFDLYDNGQNLTRIGYRSNAYLTIMDSIIPVKHKIGRYKLLNGKVFFYSKANDMVMEEIFSQGHPVKYVAYYDSPPCVGKISEIADFTRLYNNTKGSYYYEIRSCRSDDIKKIWYRKGSKKWKAYRIREK